MRSGMISWGRNSLILGSVAATLAGCSSSDLTGYHPLDKSSATSTRLPDSQPEESPSALPGEATSVDPGVASTPVTAESTDADLPPSALRPLNVIDGASVATLLKTVPDATAAAETANAIQPASATASEPTEKPRVVELLVPEKTFQRDAKSKALRVSYDDLDLLKILNLDPVTENAVDLMPEWLKGLDGQQIRIRGFMFPTFEAEGLERFVLARDNQICCFGRDPKVYDLVQVDMRSGKTTNYIPATRAFDVVGRFKIEMVSVDGKPYGLYSIQDAEVIDR